MAGAINRKKALGLFVAVVASVSIVAPYTVEAEENDQHNTVSQSAEEQVQTASDSQETTEAAAVQETEAAVIAMET